MKKLVNRALKWLFLVALATAFLSVPNSDKVFAQTTENKVPDYYYANYKFAEDWSAMWEWFTKNMAAYSIGQEIPSSEFVKLSQYFQKVFPYLTKDFASTYEKCSILAKNLSERYKYTDMEALMWNTCYKSLSQVRNRITSAYTVKPSVSVNPGGWMAPLTVTFDARNSSDPSQETIPAGNFFWYYRDEKWVDRPIWEWQVLSYTFEEAGKFIIHLVVRSSNVDNWIMDGERNLTINVTPKAADIVVYANTRKMSSISPLKIWITEAEKWIVFDGSLTKPRWWRTIMSHRWTITNNAAWFTYDTRYIEWAPSYINVPLKWNWTFKVTLTTLANEKNTVSESYYLYTSDPVTIIKQSPENWTTSSTFNFDGSASYSITNRLNTYVWEVFDSNWDSNNWNKIAPMIQWKKMTLNWNHALRPGNYLVRLTVTDMAWNQNVDTKNLYVESTRPTPQFTATPSSRRQYPSEFILDASNTMDIDVDNWVDSLEYNRSFSPDSVKIISTEDNNEKIGVQFNEKWRYIIRLTVTDQYWKFSSVSKYIDIKSTLRPEIKIIPWPVHFWKTVQFQSSINRKVWDYAWDFWDGTPAINSEWATETEHIYSRRWVYSVRLTVTDSENNDSNTVLERAFIWEIEQPIAAYRVTNSRWYYIQASDKCRIEDKNWNFTEEEAFPVDRFAKFSIDPRISVNTKWTTQGLKYIFEKEAMIWANEAKTVNQLTESFSEVGCHYVDLTINDSSVWKWDKVRIWFNVKNALPTIKNISLSFPQYSDTTNPIWFTLDTNSNKSIFDCSWTSNLTIKVTAVDPRDSDWNVSRLRFYYYNIEDPSRILEYKESWISEPYVYFVIPKIAWEYKFWVMVYDNDGWMINSEDFLASNPSVYFPAACGEIDVPNVTLIVSNTNIQVWDTVKYTIKSKITSNNEDFEVDRTFYYDFTWDGIRDLVTKKDTATYTFDEAYEEGIKPRAAVEYRWKLWQAEWAIILVKNGIKPILLYNTIWNTVIFRDMSIWLMQQRQVCFEKKECDAWNTKFRRTHVYAEELERLTWGTVTPITQNDSFIWKYDESWNHEVSIYLKNKYWIEVKTWFVVKTSSNLNNWKIAPWVNMITIPETTKTNWDLEIFLSKAMKNTLLIYINNESWEPCYVDTDTAIDSDWDGETNNDMDIACNKIAKILYEPDYQAIWRVYFTNNGQLTFKNFYVTFEGYVLELDEEKLEIYNDITTLVNGIEDLSVENTDLKNSLNKLRKDLNNRPAVTSSVIAIKEKIDEWWIKMDTKQKDLLDSILARLENEDTIIAVWTSKYEKNKQEILALLTWKILSDTELAFKTFDDEISSYWPDKRAEELGKIWDAIISDGKKNRWIDSESDFTLYFCNIYEHFDILSYTNKCSLNGSASMSEISSNYNKWKVEKNSVSESKWWLPTWLKIILIVLLWGLLTMWWIIVFFSIKARLNRESEEDEW